MLSEHLGHFRLVIKLYDARTATDISKLFGLNVYSICGQANFCSIEG
jgi:hypothetical protein